MKIALFKFEEEKTNRYEETMKGSWNQFSEKVNRAIDFLVKNSKRRISSKDVARYVGMHRSSFCRLFKKELGVTPTAYLNLMRINASKEFLSNTHLTVEKIAKKVGFPNPRHFRGQFRRYVGESPKEFRKKTSRQEVEPLPPRSEENYFISQPH